MQTAHIKAMVALAQAGAGPLAQLAARAVEVGVIVPSVLEAELVKAGYSVESHHGDKHGVWLEVTRSATEAEIKDGAHTGRTIAARAFSHDRPDALLQAIFAVIKDEARAKPK